MSDGLGPHSRLYLSLNFSEALSWSRPEVDIFKLATMLVLKVEERASMFVQCAFKNIVVVTMGVVLLLVLPLSGVCQSEPPQAEESAQTIEEVIVFGNKSLVKLKQEMYKAEEALYDTFNSFNTDDELNIRCYKEAPTGSHIKQRVCKTNLYSKLLAEETQRMMMLGGPFVYPVAKVKQMNERLLAGMTEMALEQPEMLEAIVRLREARQTMESERKRRCEGRFLICRRQ
jgi:hypothetical protein